MQKNSALFKSVTIANHIYIVIISVCVVLGSILGYVQWNAEAFVVLGLVSFFGFGLWMMSKGWIHTSRLLLCLSLPVITVALSVFTKKLPGELVSETEYFDYRYVMLGTSLIPVIIFSMRERAFLFTSLGVYFIAFTGFDLVHEAFGVGFYQINHVSPSYGISQSVVLVIFCASASGLLILRHMSDQNQEQLDRQQAALLLANNIIEEQNKQLRIDNTSLESDLRKANSNLQQTNTELIKYNNELRQFSYSVSHNLRGPIASLQGLLQLIDHAAMSDENLQYLKMAEQSIKKLESTIDDLGKIIDIRNDIFRIRQKIYLDEEVESVRMILKNEIEENNVKFICDFSKAPFLYSVRPMVASILYNLVSNAIKYRSMERQPVVELTTDITEKHFILKVKDNGLGIDLKRHGADIFKLYKRFHPQMQGKGLGLYLIKMQAEVLGGSITVNSEVNNFSEFIVSMAIPDRVHEQILLEEPHARIFYDAVLNFTGVTWKGPLQGHQYRNTYERCFEFLSVYNTPNWISDITHQGDINIEDQHWMFTKVIPRAIKNGLRHIAVVSPATSSERVVQYRLGIELSITKLGAAIQFFDTIGQACEWIRLKNEGFLTKRKSSV